MCPQAKREGRQRGNSDDRKKMGAGRRFGDPAGLAAKFVGRCGRRILGSGMENEFRDVSR